MGCPECDVAPPPAPPPPPSLPDCSIRYVGLDGTDDENYGCDPAAPLQSVERCVELAGDGGTCYLFPGVYAFMNSTVQNVGMHIRGVTNLTIAVAPSEVWPAGSDATEVTFDGTIAITGGWEERSDAHGVYYRSVQPYNDTVWQLFADGEALTSARWPNALAWSDTWWSREQGWAQTAEGSSCGVLVDGGTADPAAGSEGHQALADAGVSYDGCNLILNNEHWKIKRYTVANHTAGTSTLSYDRHPNNTLCEKYAVDVDLTAYFVDGCEAAFDVAGEWVVDGQGHLRVRLPSALAAAGTPIDDVAFAGKVQTYAAAFTECDGLTVRGVRFFATALLVYNSANATLEENTFVYQSASRRALGGWATEFDAIEAYGISAAANAGSLVADPEEFEIVVPTTWVGRASCEDIVTGLTYRNNFVYRTEGAGVACAFCSHDVFDNNRVEEAGYPFARALQFTGTMTHYVTLSRNTMRRDGSVRPPETGLPAFAHAHSTPPPQTIQIAHSLQAGWLCPIQPPGI